MATSMILSETLDTVLRCRVQPYQTILQVFARDGVQEVVLNDAERHTFLCTLPPACLKAALAAQEGARHG